MKNIKLSNDVPVEKNAIIFSQENVKKPILKLAANGDIFVKGKLIKNDLEVVVALREFLKMDNWIKIDSEADLPKVKGLYFLVTRKTGLVTIQHRTPQFNKSTLERFSHYQPIIKPAPPK